MKNGDHPFLRGWIESQTQQIHIACLVVVAKFKDCIFPYLFPINTDFYLNSYFVEWSLAASTL